jgi:hypothetical protein
VKPRRRVRRSSMVCMIIVDDDADRGVERVWVGGKS